MKERTETLQMTVTNGREFSDERFRFTFQAVDGEVLLGCDVQACVGGKAKLRKEDSVALTQDEARKVARLLWEMADEAYEQEKQK